MSRRVCLITGGARGIGRAIGLSLARDGWSIAFCYRTSADAAAQTDAALRAAGADVLAARCDVSDPDACDALIGEVRDGLGPPAALIHCAGPYHRRPLLDETPQGWADMFANNLHPVFYLSRGIARDMIDAGWGRILTFAMANADRMVAQTRVTAHYIAKAAVLMLTRALAKELAPHGITVNAISPGFIDSGSAPSAELEKMVKNIPAGHIGQVGDAVAAARFLLSEDARYVNGSNLHVSGGWGI